MKYPNLVLSFWHITLDNMPIGKISHKILDKEDAVKRINTAKEQGVLGLASFDDIAAPYKEKEFIKTKAMVDVLRTNYNANIDMDDFFVSPEDTEGSFVFPLNIHEISNDSPLMVINANFTMPDENENNEFIEKIGPLQLCIARNSLKFHLFEVL